MKFSKIFSIQPDKVSGKIVEVEIDVSRGLHNFSLVGLAAKAVDESRDRVSAAIKNSGFTSPKSKNEKIVVSLAPAELKKQGAYHDLAISLAYLLASEECVFEPLNKIFIGELSLDGKVKSLRGVLPLVQSAKKLGYTEIYLPKNNAKEAALVSGINIYPVENLLSLVAHLDSERRDHRLIEKQDPTKVEFSDVIAHNDFSDIKGQDLAKRGLEIAAAGGHNIALFGPPGTGKTMLARAFSGILPNMTLNEMLEVTSLQSISGLLGDSPYASSRPFRSPHHSASYVALIGGGSQVRPGEVSLAHNGVLFLDEFPEFSKQVLESLRQPLQDREVHISRAEGTSTFPASFILVAAMNPCPCGMYGSEKGSCKCTAYEINRYQKKVSGPIMDRIDMWLPVEHVDYELLSSDSASHEKSLDVKKRVSAARLIQLERSSTLNSTLSSKNNLALGLGEELAADYNIMASKLALSPRAYHRILKLARTIADLDGSKNILKDHILEALQYRPKENLM